MLHLEVLLASVSFTMLENYFDEQSTEKAPEVFL
jgi:hypothetical protein